MPNAPKLRLVTTVPYDILMRDYRDGIIQAAIESGGINVPEGVQTNATLSKGKNGVKVVITID